LGTVLNPDFDRLLCAGLLQRLPVSRRKGRMDSRRRDEIRRGMRVEIVLKKDQRTGKRTVGVVRDILTSAAYHSRGIKVRLDDGQVGRVQTVLPDEP